MRIRATALYECLDRLGPGDLVTPRDLTRLARRPPEALTAGADGGLAYFAYAANYLVDLDHAIIVDVEPTTAVRQAEVTAAKRMIERTMKRSDLYPARLAGDSAYGSAAMRGWLVHEQGIDPHIPVFDKSARRDGTFSREDFAYDPQNEVYRCPADHTLTTTGRLVNDGATILYRASTNDCKPCTLKPRCCPNAPARKIPRSIHEGARDMARDICNSDEGRTSRRQRKKIEMLFAHLKRILKPVTSRPSRPQSACGSGSGIGKEALPSGPPPCSP